MGQAIVIAGTGVEIASATPAADASGVLVPAMATDMGVVAVAGSPAAESRLRTGCGDWPPWSCFPVVTDFSTKGTEAAICFGALISFRMRREKVAAVRRS